MTTTTIPPFTSLYTFTPSHPTHLHCPSHHSRMLFLHYYTFNISCTVSAIITTSMPYQFHINNSFTTDDTPQSNQFNFLISSNVSLLQYIIHMFLLPFHFFSTGSTIQSSIHPISSILSLHQCSLSSFHPLLFLLPLSTPLPTIGTLQTPIYYMHPTSLLLLPTFPTLNFPTPSIISSLLPLYFLHPHPPSPTLCSSSTPCICLAHFLYCPPHSMTTTLGSRTRGSFIVLSPR